MYKIDYNRLLLWLVPAYLRKPVLLSYLNVLVSLVKTMYYDFLTSRQRNIYALEHNGQRCYFRAALNDEYDSSLRRIEILDGNRYSRGYIYTAGEEKARYLGAFIIRPATDYADTGVDFIVRIPLELKSVINIHQLHSLINYYRLASKRYDIYYE
jgi:hypothetical protein